MLSKKIAIRAFLFSAFTAGALYAYRAATPLTVAPSPAILAALPALQGSTGGAYDPVVLVDPVYVDWDRYRGLQLSVFDINNRFTLQLVNKTDIDHPEYTAEPVRIGAAELTYTVAGVDTTFQFGKASSVWYTSVPKWVAASQVLASSVVLRVWKYGTDYTDPSAATMSIELTDFTPMY